MRDWLSPSTEFLFKFDSELLTLSKLEMDAIVSLQRAIETCRRTFSQMFVHSEWTDSDLEKLPGFDVMYRGVQMLMLQHLRYGLLAIQHSEHEGGPTDILVKGTGSKKAVDIRSF